MVATLAKTQSLQQLFCPGLTSLTFCAGIDGGDLHVGGGVQMRQQVIALKDKTKVMAAQARQCQGIQGGRVLATKQVLAAAGPIETAKQIHQGRLAGAGGPDDGDHLASLNGQVEGMEHGNFLLAALVTALDPF